jgi:hypothetical protein
MLQGSHDSYARCIADLERYYYTFYQGLDFTPGGEAEMRILLGLAYANTGSVDKGIEMITNYLVSDEAQGFIGAYDYFVLGALYYQNN